MQRATIRHRAGEHRRRALDATGYNGGGRREPIRARVSQEPAFSDRNARRLEDRCDGSGISVSEPERQTPVWVWLDLFRVDGRVDRARRW